MFMESSFTYFEKLFPLYLMCMSMMDVRCMLMDVHDFIVPMGMGMFFICDPIMGMIMMLVRMIMPMLMFYDAMKVLVLVFFKYSKVGT
ncbi:MAG: hypothetical protein K0R80_1512 [Clostridia bacterium]|nr:hypothetical protein [Clostridia bacterium]